jgi:hypothetical protein
MGSVTITLAHRCSGGNHMRFELTGAKTLTLREEAPNMLTPMTDDEALAFVKGVVKLALVGRTNQQAITLLQAGVTITV